MAAADDQCAVGPDVQLLDASKIKFFHDVDDEIPLPPVPGPSTLPFGSTGIKLRIPLPAVKTAGRRQAHRISKPSLRLTNTDNAATSSHIRSGKRKATCAELSSPDEAEHPQHRLVPPRSIGTPDHPPDTDTALSDGPAITDGGLESDGSMSTLALGDADRAVLSSPDPPVQVRRDPRL
ncbi:hypothetical protein L210DRAFT_3649208 [Boletus edulis BED1]|uniref:Uncharacterized protein n=1 Tax=Boletus edulis BED1 TaxID=1328754 RepID=A0AAD4GBW4_BOLED|nr:hypothetical protein L210DRAFT_3649208 [Boletus edulis BED1]